MFRPGPGDQENNDNAGGDADREALHHRTAVPRLYRSCPARACRCQALIDTCGYFPVNSLKERGHHRVAVLGA